MSVYVDPLFATEAYVRVPRCFKAGACHMWADTLEELHAFAQRLGLRRSWFQDHRSLPHYDLTPARRHAAVFNGAVEASVKEWLRTVREAARVEVEQ